jgi:hypothetical protein
MLKDHQTMFDRIGLDFQTVNLRSLMKIKKSNKINSGKIFR